MKATVNARGMLIVEPENELEAYALGKWSAANLTDRFCASKPDLKLIVNCEQWPDAIEPVTVGVIPWLSRGAQKP
ncbi:hypothetical protein LMG28688_01595 [Paraburkholderia caffeinitolerans]|uniref:Uncharacterized protein n=1 Tax=Paraburkholderia caffeinitolerans TaxID=1723730 RepID=A0A6J5FM01_9BURK|nr:hypothetical protein [Paraburkholderia caffeinitolerans]CAB3783180.1 hypothetical protein LMG28688_01595 [Paraburkholderia caffeinitolerans]